jgi:hypothetical protein
MDGDTAKKQVLPVKIYGAAMGIVNVIYDSREKEKRERKYMQKYLGHVLGEV